VASEDRVQPLGRQRLDEQVIGRLVEGLPSVSRTRTTLTMDSRAGQRWFFSIQPISVQTVAERVLTRSRLVFTRGGEGDGFALPILEEDF
jgi:hypothetical protein